MARRVEQRQKDSNKQGSLTQSAVPAPSESASPLPALPDPQPPLPSKWEIRLRSTGASDPLAWALFVIVASFVYQKETGLLAALASWLIYLIMRSKDH
jgi:hypothetical protein